MFCLLKTTPTTNLVGFTFVTIAHGPSACRPPTWSLLTTIGSNRAKGLNLCCPRSLRLDDIKLNHHSNGPLWQENIHNWFEAWSQCNQIGWFIGLWPTFQNLWQQLICPNLLHLAKVSKSLIFLIKSFLGNFYKHLAIFYWSHCLKLKKAESSPVQTHIEPSELETVGKAWTLVFSYQSQVLVINQLK